MSIAEQVDRDLIQALKAGESVRVATLRLLKAAAKNAEVAKRDALTDAEYYVEIRRQAKMRHEAIREYERAGRHAQAQQEASELAILETYLPQQLDRDQVREVLQRVIVETGASAPGDLGKVMSHAMSSLQGRAEGAEVNRLARELLIRQSE